MTEPVILTERLRLSRLEAGDAEALFEYRSDPEVCRYQSFEPGSLEDAREFIAGLGAVALDTPGTWYQFAIRLRDAGAAIGDIGAHFVAADPRNVEIGFTLAPSYQGRGLGTEAVEGLIGFLFEALEKHRVFASVDPRNEASIALLERVGMRQEAHFRESLWFKGEWVDDLVFAILGSEWKRR